MGGVAVEREGEEGEGGREGKRGWRVSVHDLMPIS